MLGKFRFLFFLRSGNGLAGHTDFSALPASAHTNGNLPGQSLLHWLLGENFLKVSWKVEIISRGGKRIRGQGIGGVDFPLF